MSFYRLLESNYLSLGLQIIKKYGFTKKIENCVLKSIRVNNQLEKGEELCYKCNNCDGEGKVLWIENICGKKK
jgi:hypothetical protein